MDKLISIFGELNVLNGFNTHLFVYQKPRIIDLIWQVFSVDVWIDYL